MRKNDKWARERVKEMDGQGGDILHRRSFKVELGGVMPKRLGGVCD